MIYPGSIERTSFAERLEDKYYVLINVVPGSGKPTQTVEYHQLPTRPMVRVEIPVWGESLDDIKSQIRKRLIRLNPHSIVQIDLVGPDADAVQQFFPVGLLRSLAPYSMNISLRNNGYINTPAANKEIRAGILSNQPTPNLLPLDKALNQQASSP